MKQLLNARGVDIGLRNRQGLDALGLAKEYGNLESRTRWNSSKVVLWIKQIITTTTTTTITTALAAKWDINIEMISKLISASKFADRSRMSNTNKFPSHCCRNS